jgi:hypothetical protein
LIAAGNQESLQRGIPFASRVTLHVAGDEDFLARKAEKAGTAFLTVRRFHHFACIL